MSVYLVTGGAGFIGSNFIRYILDKDQDARVINFDKLTYAGNLDNLKPIENDPRYSLVHGDIADEKAVLSVFEQRVDYVVNFAAETHVDRAIGEPAVFINTDIVGTYILLECARKFEIKRFIQISTDEVYGSIDHGAADENYPLMPRNPYAAGKAGADRLAYSYYATYDLPVIITRCSNNFGPYQHPEKLVPLFVTNALDDKELPLYGDGKNIRDWIYVTDHCRAVDFLIGAGTAGEVYNIAGSNMRRNIEITEAVLSSLEKPRALIKYVKDRPGHDRRYSLSAEKLARLGWRPQGDFESKLARTIEWYAQNRWWWEKIKKGKFEEYYNKQYVQRPAEKQPRR